MAVMASSAVDQLPPSEHKSLKSEESVILEPVINLNGNGTNGHPEAQPLSNGDVSMTDAAPELLSVNGKSEILTESITLPPAIPEPPSTNPEQPIVAPAIVEQPVSDARDLPIPDTEMLDAPEPSADVATSEPMVTETTELELEVAEPPTIISEPPVVEPEPEPLKDSHPEPAESIPVESSTHTSSNAVLEVVPEPESKLELEPEPKLEPDLESESEPVVSSEPAAPISQVGQVRPRDEDEEEEPSAKRTKVDEMEPLISTPLEETQDLSQSIATDPLAAPVMVSTPVISTPDQLPSGKQDYDSNPMTVHQKKYLMEQLRKTKKIKNALPFLNPVDPIALNIPRYPEVVKTPMDLSTIEEKLKTDLYKTANDLWADFDLMVQNALIFNTSSHPVGVSAMNLGAYFAKLMSQIPKGDEDFKAKKPAPPPRPAPPRRESRHAAAAAATAATIPAAPPAPPAPPVTTTTTVVTTPPVIPPTTPTPAKSPSVSKPKDDFKPQLDQNGMPIIRRDSTTDRPKRDIVKPQRDLPYNTPKPKKKKTIAELRFCEFVNKELAKPKHAKYAWPFQQPVDPVALNIPSYHKVIKKPMDFGTMATKLNNGEYDNAKDYYNDGKMVFANCFKFNPPQDEVHKMGKQMEAAFDELWAKKDEWLAQNAPPSEPASEQEDEEEEEEEEDEDAEEADKMRRMLEIQKQIAALSAEAMSLSTNPQAKKPKKPKGEKKQKRGSLPGASSKPAKVKKTPKVKKLTLEEKRYVSEGIAQLDEPSMRKAVQIIRNGVPALKDVHDDELELDVDEIPEPVLQDLYRFVKSHRKAVGADVTGDDEDWEEPTGRRSSGANKPAATQRKKNKPMSAREQENKIAQVRKQLERFDASGGDDNDSSEEDSSSSSEEE